MSESNKQKSSYLQELLTTKDIVICSGAGGVGKTTISAALGAVSAHKCKAKVLVLTIDPAKRLSSALGLAELGNEEKLVPSNHLEKAGMQDFQGELWAAMLDAQQSWDSLVRKYAPSDEVVNKILLNPIYKNISSRFVYSHEYIAMERLYEAYSEKKYDLIIVDTPPTRNAIDFLKAPERMADFFSSRLLRWLTVPSRSKIMSFASRPFYQIADRVLGTKFLSEISEFFLLFQTMYPGFISRAASVQQLLHDSKTTFIVVSTLDSVPMHEAESFITELEKQNYQLGAIVLNRVLPKMFSDPSRIKLAKNISQDPDLVEKLFFEEQDLDPDQLDLDRQSIKTVFKEVANNFLNFSALALKEQSQKDNLKTTDKVVIEIPFLETELNDVEALFQLGKYLWE